MAAGKADETSKLLGQLRLAIAKKENLLNPDAFEFLWVTDFPLLEYNAEDGRWYSMHHPFTAPHDEDVDKLESDPGAVRAKAYDLVLNGSEIGGGSVRIHSAALQARVFQRLGITRRGGEAAASASSSRRSNTARRRTAASRSGSTVSSRFSPASRRFARSSRSRRPPMRSISWLGRLRRSIRNSCVSSI